MEVGFQYRRVKDLECELPWCRFNAQALQEGTLQDRPHCHQTKASSTWGLLHEQASACEQQQEKHQCTKHLQWPGSATFFRKCPGSAAAK